MNILVECNVRRSHGSVISQGLVSLSQELKEKICNKNFSLYFSETLFDMEGGNRDVVNSVYTMLNEFQQTRCGDCYDEMQLMHLGMKDDDLRA